MSTQHGISADHGSSMERATRNVHDIRRALLGSTFLLLCTVAIGTEEDQWNAVLLTDYGGMAVRSVALRGDDRYRFIEESISTHSPGAKDHRIRTLAMYAVDCEVPRRALEMEFAVNSQVSGVAPIWGYLKTTSADAFSPKDLALQSQSTAEKGFSDRLLQLGLTYASNLPNAVTVMSDYVCRAKQQGDTPRNVGASINAKGGFDDLKVLTCAMNGARSVAQSDGEVGFSEQGGAIIFNGVWQSTASVSDNILAFSVTASDAVVWDVQISRSTGALTMQAQQRQATETVYPTAPPGKRYVTQEEYDQNVENIYINSASPAMVQLGMSMRANRLQAALQKQQMRANQILPTISGNCAVATAQPKKF